ncbi:MAG: signal recognition particle receptor subunit alpha, partial [Eubacteriales bacterium]|nr:signal recognition particle receptor subunit alpha [Eubacteriales bacterium]
MAGFFARLKEGLSKTRGNMTGKIDELARNIRQIDDDFFEELTDILLLGDVGVAATEHIIAALRQQVRDSRVKDPEQAKAMLQSIIIQEMDIPRPSLKWPM